MSTTERPSSYGTASSGDDLESFRRLSDAEWDEATKRVEKAVDRYAHIDFGRLADEVVDEYVKARAEEEALDRLGAGFPFTSTAPVTTRGMVTSLVGVHTNSGRVRTAGISGAGFLAPLAVLLAVVYLWHSNFGWYGVPRVTLLAGFVGFTVLSAFLIASFVRDGFTVRALSKQGALALSIGAVAATIVSPFAIRQLRSSESDKLALASKDVSLSVVDAVAAADNPISRVTLMAGSQERYDVVPEKKLGKSNTVTTPQGEVSIQTRGLPGYVTATVDSPESVRVIWSRPLAPDITKALIKQGRVEALPGGARLLTRDGAFPVSDNLAKAIPPEEKVVGVIDAGTRKVTRLVPVSPSRMASAPVSARPATR